MNTPNIIKTFEKPEKFVDLGTGFWYYNFGVTSQEVVVPIEMMGEPGEEVKTEQKTEYSYIQVRLNCRPEYAKCVEALIRQYVSASQEFDLINTANKALMNNQEVPEDYREYLNLLESLKAEVKKDFSE